MDIYIPPLTGKPEQQRFTTRSGILTGNDTMAMAMTCRPTQLSTRLLKGGSRMAKRDTVG